MSNSALIRATNFSRARFTTWAFAIVAGFFVAGCQALLVAPVAIMQTVDSATGHHRPGPYTGPVPNFMESAKPMDFNAGPVKGVGPAYRFSEGDLRVLAVEFRENQARRKASLAVGGHGYFSVTVCPLGPISILDEREWSGSGAVSRWFTLDPNDPVVKYRGAIDPAWSKAVDEICSATD